MPPVLEDISNVSKRLTIVIPAEDIDDFVSEIYEDLLKKTRVKGFRSGKAPKAMLMKMHIDLVKRNLLEKLISPKIIDSLVELNIEPATTPTLETIPEIKDGEPMTITTTFEIYPEFEVPDFSSITLTKPPILVTDEMVDKELDRLRYRMAIVSAAEPDHTIVSGDEVTIEMLVPKDDQYVSLKEYDRPAKPIIKNDKNKKHKRPPRPEADTKSPLLKVIAGLTNSESPELSQSVLHHTPGDVYDLPFTFPKNFGIASLAEKEMIVRVKIVEVTLKELPEINDDFVRDLNIEDITSLKELREIERNRLIDEQNQRIRQNLQNQLFLKLDELITFDQVPPNLLESQIDREIVHIRDMAMYHNQRELKESVEQWLNNQELRDKYRQQAIFNIKIQAIKFKLLKAENITVEDSEVADYVKRLSEYAQYDQADDLNSKQFTLQIAERLRNDKLIDVLLSKVQFKEFTPEKPESIPGQPESTPEQPKSPDGETKGETTDETLGETPGESSDNPS